MKKLVLIAPFLFLPLLGCEDEEVQAISEAQACLNEVSSDVDAQGSGATAMYNKAKSCGDKLSGYSSVQANSIKCSAYLISGGLDAARFNDIIEALDGGGGNAPMQYIGGLALTKPTTTDGYERFQLAQSPCSSAGSEFYKDVISLVTVGTETSQFFPGGFPEDLSTIATGDINTAIDGCAGDTDCATAIANTAVSLATDYCSEEGAEEDVCADIQAAVDGAPNDAQLTEDLLCLLQGNTENCR